MTVNVAICSDPPRSPGCVGGDPEFGRGSEFSRAAAVGTVVAVVRGATAADAAAPAPATNTTTTATVAMARHANFIPMSVAR